MKGKNLRVIYSSKTYSTFIHASVFVCLRNDVVLSIMLEFSFFFVSPMIGLIRPDFYKHNERETVYRLVGSWNEAKQSLNDTQMLVVFCCLENWPADVILLEFGFSSLRKETKSCFVLERVYLKIVCHYFFDQNFIECNNKIDDGKHKSETNRTEDRFYSWWW